MKAVGVLNGNWKGGIYLSWNTPPRVEDPAKQEAMAICQEIRDRMSQDAYDAWIDTTPDDNAEFMVAARAKLAEILTGFDEQERQAEKMAREIAKINGWLETGTSPTQIALTNALYNVIHASPDNREWAMQRYAEEVAKAIRHYQI